MAKARQSYESGSLPKKKGVTVCGKQPDSTLWAISHDLFIDEVTGICYWIIATYWQLQS